MLQILTHDILPVFAMLALGFAMARMGMVNPGEARAANRLAFLVFQPALIFPLVAGIDLTEFDLNALATYVLCEILAFAAAYGLARRIFRRAHLESWLLAMAVVFVNSLLYIWPVSFLIYGEAAALPITAIVAWDATASFAFFIISMEIMAGRGGGDGALARVARNPVLLAIALGILVNATNTQVPEPILTAADFAGAAAAPLTLFALGVILSGHGLWPSPTVAGVSAMKLLAFPLLVAGALSLTGTEGPWRDLFVLNAAGPSGAMAFALALLYGVRTDCIAPVI
ncbi:MAG: AEC family transporter, partial [Pseudomonadota bacterium]